MAIGVSRHGSQYLNADAALTTTAAGDPVYVYSIHIISGPTAGKVKLYNGVDATGTLYVYQAGTASCGLTIPFGEGFHFPGGCYVDIDGNTTSVIVSYDCAKQ